VTGKKKQDIWSKKVISIGEKESEISCLKRKEESLRTGKRKQYCPSQAFS